MKYNGFYFWMFKGSMKQVPAEKYNKAYAAQIMKQSRQVYPRAAAVRSVRLIGSSFASHKSTEGAAFGRHPPERRATLWISYGIRSRNG